MKRYYHISTLVDIPAEPEEKWYESYRNTFPCLHPKTEEPIDIKISTLGENAPYSFVNGVVNEFAHIDFLEALGSAAVNKYLRLGSLIDSNGNILDNYKTLGSSQKFWIRGKKESRSHFCLECGQFLYDPEGKEYLLRRDLTGQPLYYGDQLNGFVIAESIFKRMRKKRWNKIYIKKLAILEKPLDGMPEDLSKIKTPSDLPHVQALAGIIGCQGLPLPEARERIKPLVKLYGEGNIDSVTKWLYEVDTHKEPPLVQLTRRGREIARF